MTPTLRSVLPAPRSLATTTTSVRRPRVRPRGCTLPTVRHVPGLAAGRSKRALTRERLEGDRGILAGLSDGPSGMGGRPSLCLFRRDRTNVRRSCEWLCLICRGRAPPPLLPPPPLELVLVLVLLVLLPLSSARTSSRSERCTGAL